MSNYSKAEKRSANWYGDGRYAGAKINPARGVIHTTEGTSLPGYESGATAPHYTAVPDFKNKKLKFYAHFPDEQSARALRNQSGGVETNTLNCIQIELVGTCDESTSRRWGKTPHIYWGNAPDWALRDVADFVADMYKRHQIPVSGPGKPWVKYPASYGNAPQRMSFKEWTSLHGWCGHQHVPENVHGDPGNINWAAIERYAKAIVNPPQKSAPVSTARGLIEDAIKLLRQAKTENSGTKWRLITARKALESALKTLPKENTK